MAYNVGDWVVSDVYFDFDSNLPYGGVHQILGLTNVDGDLVYTLKDTRGVIRYAMEFLFRKQTTEDFFKETDEEKELAEYKRYAKITKERAMGQQKYKVGDVVKVRDDIEVGTRYYMENGQRDMFVDEMSPWIGKVVTIEDDAESHYNIVGSCWNFTDEMFEGFADEDDEDDEDDEGYATGGEISEEKMAEFIHSMQRPVDISFELTEEVSKALREGLLTISKEGVKVGVFSNDEAGVDMVNHPPHYQNGGIETLDIIRMCLTKKEFKGYLKGQVMKYRERAQFKGNPEQDYAKAKFYYDALQELKAEKKSKKRGKR